MNDVLGAINNFPQSFGNYCYATQHAGLSAIVKLKEMRNNPDVYQKIGQIAFSSLQLIMIKFAPTSALAELSLVVSAVGMHDFYRVVQYPRHWFFPINAQKIDEKAVLDDLIRCLIPQFIDEENFVTPEQGAHLYAKAQECLHAQLELMAKHDDAYRSVDEFIGQVQKRLQKVQAEDFGFDFSTVDLSELTTSNDYNVKKWIRHVPTLEKIMNINWAVADVLTFGWWLGVWNIVNTTKLAETMGQYRAFGWAKNQNLETCLIGSICTGYVWKLLESVRKLRDENLTKVERSQAQWNAVTSVADLAFFGTIFTNMIGQTKINNTNVQLLALGARSLGLLSLLIKPKNEFFEIS